MVQPSGWPSCHRSPFLAFNIGSQPHRRLNSAGEGKHLTLYDEGQEGSECGDGQDRKNVADDREELLPVPRHVQNVPPGDSAPADVGGLLGAREIGLHPPHGVQALRRREEPRSPQRRRQDRQREEPGEDRQRALDDEDALPPREAGRVDPQQAIGQEAGEGPRDRVHAGEQAHAPPGAVLGEHGGEVEHADLGEARLGRAEEEAQSDEGRAVSDSRVRDADGAPGDELDGYPVFRPNAVGEGSAQGL